MPSGDTDFAEAVRRLDMSLQGAADILGISLRAAKYYAAGTMQPPVPVRRLLCSYIRHGVPADRYDDFGFLR